jgi:hypothetical protein
MRSNFTVEETQAILAEHYPWAAPAGPCAGLVNSRANPHSLYTFEWWSWALGNSMGVSMHCAVVEAVYTRLEFS